MGHTAKTGRGSGEKRTAKIGCATNAKRRSWKLETRKQKIEIGKQRLEIRKQKMEIQGTHRAIDSEPRTKKRACLSRLCMQLLVAT